MANTEEFKGFVKENPKLIKYVKNGSMTWQKFYELYDLYGKDNEIWNNYLKEEKTVTQAAATFTLADTFNFLKNIDLNSLQNGISSIQRVVGVVSDLTNNKTTPTSKTEYKPRPLYKHFED
ncbi:MAG: spore coat protein YlbD [Bacilli bacterium]